MKRNMIVAAILAMMCAAHAQAQVSPTTFPTPGHAQSPVTAVMGSASSTDTVVGVSISSSIATSIVISTIAAFRQVCVQNLDTTAALFCSENVNVSSQTANALHGVTISAATSATQVATPTCFSIVPYTNFYCLSGNVTAASNSVVIRAR